MGGIARDEHAAAAVALGHQQVQGPLVDMQDLDFDVASGEAADSRGEIRIAGQPAVQGEMPAIVLDDEHAAVQIGEPVMPRPVDLRLAEQVGRTEEHLAQLGDAAAPFELDLELLADDTAAAVTTDQ